MKEAKNIGVYGYEKEKKIIKYMIGIIMVCAIYVGFYNITFISMGK